MNESRARRCIHYTHRRTFNLSSPRNDFKLCRMQSIRFHSSINNEAIAISSTRQPVTLLRFAWSVLAPWSVKEKKCLVTSNSENMSRQYPKVPREEAYLSSNQLAVLVCNQAILREHVVVISKDCRKTTNPIITQCK
jgi:hypothetical protein